MTIVSRFVNVQLSSNGYHYLAYPPDGELWDIHFASLVNSSGGLVVGTVTLDTGSSETVDILSLDTTVPWGSAIARGRWTIIPGQSIDCNFPTGGLLSVHVSGIVRAYP